MTYTICFIIVFILLNKKVDTISIENTKEQLLSRDAVTFEQLNKMLPDPKIFENQLNILHDQLTSKNINKIAVKDLILQELENIESLRQDIDLKFNKKSEQLQFADRNRLDLRLRYSRAVPRKASNECKMPHEKLVNLKTEIYNVLQNTSETSRSNCELNNDVLDCEELMKYLECGLNNLKNSFIIATSRGSNSDEFNEWKTAFEKLNASYLKLSDNMARTSEQMYKKEIENLKSTVQLLLHIITILDNSPCVVNVVIET